MRFQLYFVSFGSQKKREKAKLFGSKRLPNFEHVSSLRVNISSTENCYLSLSVLVPISQAQTDRFSLAHKQFFEHSAEAVFRAQCRSGLNFQAQCRSGFSFSTMQRRFFKHNAEAVFHII